MNEYIDALAHVHVAVIGDLALDCYHHGEVNRISPEAPVPVMRAPSERPVPGGAANVAANLATLDVHVHLVGERQQIVRIDHEDRTPWSDELQRACILAALDAIDVADVVVLSDYGKGVCSDLLIREVIEHAARKGKRILVDPKRRDLSIYSGASILTPNRKELSDATGQPCETDDEAALAVAHAQSICDADVLLTRSEKGMSYFPRGGVPIHMPTVAQDVFDVSGAGDTVVAVLAATVGAGIPLLEGMRLANHAAGIVVSKVGTATVTRAELAESLVEDAPARDGDGDRVGLEDPAQRYGRSRNQRIEGLPRRSAPSHLLTRHVSGV